MSAPLGRLPILERVVYQTRELGNRVLALRELAAAFSEAQREGRGELVHHLRTLAPWVAERLADAADPAALLADLRLPAALGLEAPRPRRSAKISGLQAGLMLVDSAGSGVGLLGRLERRGGLPVDERLPPRCAPAAQRALCDAEQAAFAWAARRWRLEAERLGPDRGFRLHGPPALEWAVDGRSIGLAAGLLVAAELLGQPLPRTLYATGALTSEGLVEPVGGVSQKIEAALREDPGAALLLLPRGQRRGQLGAEAPGTLRVVEVESLDEALEAVFDSACLAAAPPATGLNIEALVRRGVELFEKGDQFANARTLLEAALSALEARRDEFGDASLHRREELLARWRVAAVAVHGGETESALRGFARAGVLADALFAEELIEPALVVGVRGSWAVALRDAWRYDEAEALLGETLTLQRRLHLGARQRGRLLGNLGELQSFLGRHDDARETLLAALEALEKAYPDEVPRARCYLGDLERRAGDPVAAARHFDAGLEANHRVQTGAAANEAFLRYGRARLRFEQGDHGAALDDLEVMLSLPLGTSLYPGRRALALRGCCRLAVARDEEERAGGIEDLQRAGDEVADGGPLVRFACKLAHGTLALELLQDAPVEHHERIVELLEGLTEAAEAAGGPPGEAAPALRELTSRLPESAPELVITVAEVERAFPY